MTSTLSTSQHLAEKIAATIASTQAGTKARASALSGIKWSLESESGLVVGLDDEGGCILCPAESPLAQVFDGRDNEAMKLRVYQMIIGETLSIVLLP